MQFVSPTGSSAIDAGQSVVLRVNEPVTWSLQAVTGKPSGSLGNETPTTATYVAPTSATGQLQVTVVATSTADTAQSAVTLVVINPALAASGALSGNKSCQYDPINQIGVSNGTVGIAYPNLANIPPGPVGGTGPYTWSVASGSLPVGLTLGWQARGNNPSEAFLTGTPVNAGCSQISLQVTDATGATATSSTNYIIITPAPLKLQTPNYADAYSATPYPPTAFAVSGGSPPYQNWTISPEGAQLPPGMTITPDANNSAAAVLSGTPAACTVDTCQSYSPTLLVEDSQTPYPAVGSVTLNLNEWPSLAANACMPNTNGGSGVVTNPTNLSGEYAFLLRGFDANGPIVMAGSFTADGAGNVTGGVEDVMRTTGSQVAATITSGSYSLVDQGTLNTFFEQAGCLQLTTSGGSTTFAISMGGCSTSSNPLTGACNNDAQGAPGLYTTGRLIEFDDATGRGTRGSGIVRMQSSSAFSGGLSGLYAFGLSGWDSSGGRYATAGSFSASSSSLSAVAGDINDAGNFLSAQTGGTGTAGAVDPTTGRGAVSLSIGSSSGAPSLSNLAVYVVSANEAIVANTGTPGASNPVIGGEVISTTGPFSAASLQNTHIFHTGGLASNGPDPNIGILQFDGVGGFTGTQYEDQAGTLGTASLSGSYSVDGSTGRLVLSAPTQTQNVGDHPLVGYVIPVPATLTRENCAQLASCVTGFLLSSDSTAQAGQLEFQTSLTAPPPPFSTLYITGYLFYGTDEILDVSSLLLAGTSFANPTGSKYAGIQSVSYPNPTYCLQSGCAVLVPNEALSASGTYGVSSNGAATVGGETVAVTNGNVTFYIDESPLNAHPSVTVVEQ